MNPKKRSEVEISCHMGIWVTKARLRPIGIKPFGSHNFEILALTFTNESNKCQTTP